MSRLRDAHYEEKVFPLIAEGKDNFNWWAAFFGFYWYPYKGLWKEWWLYEILPSLPLCILLGFENLVTRFLGILLCGFLIVYLGNVSNGFYQKRYETIQKKNHLGRGMLGILLALVLTLPMEGIVPFFLRHFTGSP